ncbi:G-box-binding factor 1-like isoform X2 [Durio zibethinus]|uniref:G-box-binding factor 1-like isoform X2 n=1 Tax=Durio zibethinus TaxID=66656 RepID=A0A6P5ZFT3_DURZI|nr:G-box-binding factor 1-like isoform X2 [Durio zibethinus]
MGTEEESTPAKPSKSAASTQEVLKTPSYPDWTNPMQAYYGAGATPPPFFASTVASPTPHPYIWGGQHPLMPPYGTPVPFPAIYPPGGVYAHPNIATNNADHEGKGADGKDRGATKKSKGTSGSKVGESGKAASGSGNDGRSQCESGSEGTSDGSDENNQQEPAADKKSFGQMLADANAQNNTTGALVPGKPVVSMPAATVNIGMDLWSGCPAATGAAKMRPNSSGAVATVPAGGVMPDQWIQDERELKRQKRKQSNRESARRSRLRKQADCEELQARVENLANENRNLREELKKLSDECEKLTSENSSIKVWKGYPLSPDTLPEIFSFYQCSSIFVPWLHASSLLLSTQWRESETSQISKH